MKFVLIFLALLSGSFVNAQNLLINQSPRGLYVQHKVEAKQGIYSLGRLYNVSPRHIASFNQIDLNKGLAIDQVIRIPVTDTNFSQKVSKGAPVYHFVLTGDNLKLISTAYKKVPVATLQKWNALKSGLKPGSLIIVGFMIAKELPSVTITKPAEPIMPESVATNIPGAETTVAKEAQQTGKEQMKETNVEKIETIKPPTGERKDPLAVAKSIDFFRPYYEEQIRSKAPTESPSVTSGIFKTNSGWQDGKYYLLIDKVPTGSIVKITNPVNNKDIYAKVLGEMNGIRQNQGLDIRISNAAAAALGVTDEEKFIIKLNY